MANDSTLSFGANETQELIASLEAFLSEHYDVRRNVLSNNYEYREKGEDSSDDFKVLTPEALNSIVLDALKQGLEGPVNQLLDKIIHSNATALYNPIVDYLEKLPEWDGKDRIDDLFYRLHGITAEQVHYAHRWLLSCVAHWLGMDSIHGNQTVLLIIGNQGCGKSTFAAQLLPVHLRRYYLDHINLANKNDKEIAISDNLLVNIDEFDQVKASQQAELKQTISKGTVNGRKIYGRVQENRPRHASFIATTNNHHPLKDPTGSRRYLTAKITDGMLIDNQTEIEYEQVYAQLMHELKEDKMTYWFTDEENQRLQRLNAQYYEISSLDDMIEYCYRKADEGEECETVTISEVLTTIGKEFPGIQNNRSMQTKVGKSLSAMNVKSIHGRLHNTYALVSRVA